MATTPDFSEYILDAIGDGDCSLKRMFGEYALYLNKRVVGFICDNTLFLKITKNSEEVFKGMKVKKAPAYPGSKLYFSIGEDILENRKLLQKVLYGIYEDVPDKKVKKK